MNALTITFIAVNSVIIYIAGFLGGRAYELMRQLRKKNGNNP